MLARPPLETSAFVPDHLQWICGEVPYASPAEARSMDLRLDFMLTADGAASSFRAEVEKAVALIDRRRAGKPVALCYTAGLDSDLIAFELARQSIPFTPFFLDLWGVNTAEFERNRRYLGLEVQEVRLERIYFYEEVCLPVFRRFGIENPTYLALSYLFEQIPDGYFIVTGDGDLNRSGGLFQSIAKDHPISPGQISLPFSISAIFNYLWAKRANRPGEYAFFSSTAGLMRSMLEHPDFGFSYPFSSTRAVLLREYPELPARGKTTNWDGSAYSENVWVREWLERHARQWPDFAFWRGDAGTVWESALAR